MSWDFEQCRLNVPSLAGAVHEGVIPRSFAVWVAQRSTRGQLSPWSYRFISSLKDSYLSVLAFIIKVVTWSDSYVRFAVLLIGITNHIKQMFHVITRENQWLCLRSCQVITLSFQVFETESCCDHVWVYDGIDTSAPLFAKLSGSLEPSEAFKSTQRYLFVRFSSNRRETAIGFNATYASSSGKPLDRLCVRYVCITVFSLLLLHTECGREIDS